jgi:hypothetical protein
MGEITDMAIADARLREAISQRVRQLEQQLASERKRAEGLQSMNSTLAAEVDRQRAVVQAAITYRHQRPFRFKTPLDVAVDAYEASRGAS